MTVLALAAVCGSRFATTGNTGPPSTLVYPPWKHTLGLHRVNQTHLDLYSGYRKRFSSPQGVAATKLYYNDKPSPGDDDELTVYGINAGTGEIFYNTSMFSLGFFGQPGTGDGEFNDAVGICADDSGNVFVADRGNNRVVRLRNNRNHLEYVGEFDLAGTGRRLRSPTGVALEDGILYVTDTGNDRIVRVGINGRPLTELEPSRPFERPCAIAVIASGAWNYYSTRFVVVTDSLNQRLTKLTPNGEVLGTRRFRDFSPGEGGFDFVAVDYYANVYVTDQVQGCIYKFDRYLRFLTRFGCDTGGSEDLVEPRGIAIYRRFGQVFVAEAAGASYFWVGTDIQNLSCTGHLDGDGLTVRARFLLTEQSYVTIRLESERGEVIKVFTTERFMEPGERRRSYRLPASDLPCDFAKCTYFLSIEARATYSSAAYHRIRLRTPLRRF